MVSREGRLLTNKVNGWVHWSARCLSDWLIGCTEKVLRRHGWVHVKVEELGVGEQSEIVCDVVVRYLLLEGFVQVVEVRESMA
jgi:hypothetical protein